MKINYSLPIYYSIIIIGFVGCGISIRIGSLKLAMIFCAVLAINVILAFLPYLLTKKEKVVTDE